MFGASTNIIIELPGEIRNSTVPEQVMGGMSATLERRENNALTGVSGLDSNQNSSDSLSFSSFSRAATCALSTEISASMEAILSFSGSGS